MIYDKYDHLIDLMGYPHNNTKSKYNVSEIIRFAEELEITDDLDCILILIVDNENTIDKVTMDVKSILKLSELRSQSVVLEAYENGEAKLIRGSKFTLLEIQHKFDKNNIKTEIIKSNR